MAWHKTVTTSVHLQWSHRPVALHHHYVVYALRQEKIITNTLDCRLFLTEPSWWIFYNIPCLDTRSQSISSTWTWNNIAYRTYHITGIYHRYQIYISIYTRYAYMPGLKILQMLLIARRANRFFEYDSPSQNLVAIRIKTAEILQKNDSQPGCDVWDNL